MIGFFYVLQLQTRITSTGIEVRYFPLWSTRLTWEDIQQAQIIEYAFVGYGIRFSKEYGTVYNS